MCCWPQNALYWKWLLQVTNVILTSNYSKFIIKLNISRFILFLRNRQKIRGHDPLITYISILVARDNAMLRNSQLFLHAHKRLPYKTDWKKCNHSLRDRRVPVSIEGPLKPFNFIVKCCLRDFRVALNWVPIFPRDARLSNSFKFDRCIFFFNKAIHLQFASKCTVILKVWRRKVIVWISCYQEVSSWFPKRKPLDGLGSIVHVLVCVVVFRVWK